MTQLDPLFHRFELPPPQSSETNHIPIVRRQIGSWRIAVERSAFTGDELKRRYDQLARLQPHILDWLGYTEVYANLTARLASAVPNALPDGAWVLDCGAGTGALTLALGTATNARLRHYLLDLSPRMLEVAGGRVREAGIDASLIEGDIREIPYDDGAFDFVMAAHVIEHLPDPVAALREMRRILRPGGRMLVLVTCRSVFGSLLQLKWRIHRADRHELHDWLHQCGLSQIHSLPLEGSWWCNRMSIACVGTRDGKR